MKKLFTLLALCLLLCCQATAAVAAENSFSHKKMPELNQAIAIRCDYFIPFTVATEAFTQKYLSLEHLEKEVYPNISREAIQENYKEQINNATIYISQLKPLERRLRENAADFNNTYLVNQLLQAMTGRMEFVQYIYYKYWELAENRQVPNDGAYEEALAANNRARELEYNIDNYLQGLIFPTEAYQITYEAYTCLESGMTYPQVRKFLKIPGHLEKTPEAPANSKTYVWYSRENQYALIRVIFENGRLVHKECVGLEDTE